MDWTAQVDNYCERLDASFWAEPYNALTNLAFILAAVAVLRLIRGQNDRGAQVMVALVSAIGIGSFLFHTYATTWAAVADVLPITLFILASVYLLSRRVLRLGVGLSGVAMLAFVPYSAAMSAATVAIAGPLNGSASYVPVPILMLVYAAAAQRLGDAASARRLCVAAGILAVSLTFRTIDEAVCPSLPIGTHFLWHLLNGLLLGWMIRLVHLARPVRPVRQTGEARLARTRPHR